MSSEYPGRRRFAFTVYDDTDVATLENIAPVYTALAERQMRCTKTVWPLNWPGASSNFRDSATLEDPAYAAFVRALADDGFEIGWHNATMESSDRAATERALARFGEVFGCLPRVHANHAYNQENLYWGEARLDSPLLRLLYARLNGRPAGFYQGHCPGTPWFWGDLCQQHFEYVRNLSFDTVNLLSVNPTLPYTDATRPYARWWFSATDAEDADAFVRLLTPSALDALEADGGVCIVATHFGKGFAPGGRLRDDVRGVLDDLARRPGWFVPVGTLLDHLRQTRGGPLPSGEWRRMQWRWAADLVRRRLAA